MAERLGCRLKYGFGARWVSLITLGLVAAGPGSAQIQFTDVTEAAGIDKGHFQSPTFHSLGINWIDFNVDGLPDLFVVNGIDLESVLYRNDGGGQFTQVNHLLPTLPNYDFAGSVFADYDNDGDPDIYIYTDNEQFELEGANELDGPPNLLLENLHGEVANGEVMFVDVAADAGVDDLAAEPLGDYPGMRAKTAAWLDYDLDGCIDLFVGHMVMQSDGHSANRDRLYRNTCDGRFEDVTQSAGLYDTVADSDPSYRPTLAVLAGHLNQDLYPDLYIVSVSPGVEGMYLPEGHIDRVFFGSAGGVFIAQDFPGVGDDAQAGMGIDLADIDLDSDVDLYISDLWEHGLGSGSELESPPPFGNPLYLNDGGGGFLENSADLAGVEANSSWGVSFIDADQDAYEDLLVGTTGVAAGLSYFYRNRRDGTFKDVSLTAGIVSGYVRGTATADYDGDGDLDLALVNDGGPLLLYRNDSVQQGNWVQFRLAGTASNRSAIGAIVVVEAGGHRLRREVLGGSSTHSEDELTVHFGLGTASTITRTIVLWPSGLRQQATNLDVNQIYEVVEAAPISDGRRQKGATPSSPLQRRAQ